MGHDHEHCSCCEHEHEHGHSHDHGEEKENIKRDFIIIFICAAVFAASLIPALEPFGFWICLVSAAVAARETLKEGIKGIFKFRFDEASLMTIAVIAAFAIGEFREGTMVALLFSFGEELEDLAVERSKKSIAALADIRPDSANVVIGDDIKTQPAKDIDLGTKILVKVGERVPLDCRVISESVMADTSALTGESLPVNIAEGDILKAGCVVLASPALGETVSGYGDSAAARIIDMVENASEKKGETEKFITRFCGIYTPVVVGLAALLFLVTWLGGILEVSDAAHRALVFLVSSCPCALVLSVPLSYFAGIGSASRGGVIIKGSEYCERLAKVKNAVFDKTGTLTSGKLKVAEIKLHGDYSEDEVLRFAAAAEAFSDHPIAKGVIDEAEKRGIIHPAADKVTEIAGKGVTVMTEGKAIVCGNKKLFEQIETAFPLDNGASLYVAVDGVLIGSIYLEDSIREDSKGAISSLHGLGVEHAYMLTGDNEKAAAKVAKECGLDGYFASLMPEDKVTKTEEIKKTGTTVFVGDGINDAPVLAAADIGAAMGMGSDAAIESADIVLMKGGLSALPRAIYTSKRVVKCVRQNVIFILAVKIIVLILGAFGYAPIWLAVFADVGTCIISLLWSLRLLKIKY